MCIVSKRRGEGKLKWVLNNKPSKRVSFDKQQMENDKPIMDKTSTDKTGRKWQIGQCLSCDDVGPISPESLEG